MSNKSVVSQSTPAISKFLLFFTVTISGGAVMILELLGTRIIAPYYGVSLYVWSSLISVTMIALALGYYCGGFLADRYPKLRLTHIFILLNTSILFRSKTSLTDPEWRRLYAC